MNFSNHNYVILLLEKIFCKSKILLIGTVKEEMMHKTNDTLAFDLFAFYLELGSIRGSTINESKQQGKKKKNC